MNPVVFTLVVFAVALSSRGADLPPDKGNTIPESSKRPVVVSKVGGSAMRGLPAFDLPDGYTLTVAAASPLVIHPTMGCVDDRGRMFVGEGVGVNWNKAQLEANPPNRVLMLEDTDGDGRYDKSTIFADKMTFPQGACWANGSLYVCSPPGLWKLTDGDNDGVAEQREMIVSGFDYTGNAADVHGPKLHPNGRLYWCHGRKGHKVVGKDGMIAHEGLASGIWSCKPDGSDVQWHSLGCADNPTGLDFTPSGDVVGTCNLYYSNPRGDTLMHWLLGGVYERPDQLTAIAGLQRTLEKMPVIHNFGHVAVSGCAFWHDSGYPGTALQLFVTHFNTQRLVRTELIPSGSTYRATENEFLKIHDADVHLTDVFADRDGSLLVVNTGGWFRIGCPSGLMAKPDVLGAVYRVRASKTAAVVAAKPAPPAAAPTMTDLKAADPHVRRRALEWITQAKPASIDPMDLIAVLASRLDPPLEHAAIHACATAPVDTSRFLTQALSHSHSDGGETPEFRARLLKVADLRGYQGQNPEDFRQMVARAASSGDAVLYRPALEMARRDPGLTQMVTADFAKRLAEAATQRDLPVLTSQLAFFMSESLSDTGVQQLLGQMLNHPENRLRQAALEILSAQTSQVGHEAWLPPLGKMLAEAPSPLLLDAIKRLKTHSFDRQLQSIVDDAKRPLTLRLKALAAVKGLKITGETFGLLKSILADDTASAAARIQAAGMLGAASLNNEQIAALAPALAKVGPVEMKDLLALVKRLKDKDVEVARAVAVELAKNPALISQQESIYRTAFSNLPPDIFETIVLPARRKAEEIIDAKKRQLGALAEKAATTGDAVAGRKHFEAGKGTCVACHKIGEIGRAIGPDLSKIGSIRSERDLLESIIFPSSTLARDYEAHILETAGGQTIMGVIRSHTADGLLVMDVAGQEKNVPHVQIVSNTTLTTSLMPMGLDGTMPEKELLDLVAYLRHLK